MAIKELLILILVLILIGISIAVAINVNLEHNKETNKDAIRQELLSAATHANAFFYRPRAMGGGGGSFATITISDLKVDTLGTNGTYSITSRDVNSFTIEGITRDGQETISATITKSGLSWN